MSDSSHPAAPDGVPPPQPETGPEAEAEAEAVANADAEFETGDGTTPDFEPVPVRYRYDGWVPDKQLEFIERLAVCGCVEEAARSVGLSKTTAYALRGRTDAQAFRLAWDAAMDIAITRLSDDAMARAIHGVPVPIFHGSEQVGERRQFNERLTMFLLRYRDPVRYGKWLDKTEVDQPSEGPSAILAYRIGRMVRVAWAAFNAAWDGKPAPEPANEVPARSKATQH